MSLFKYLKNKKIKDIKQDINQYRFLGYIQNGAKKAYFAALKKVAVVSLKDPEDYKICIFESVPLVAEPANITYCKDFDHKNMINNCKNTNCPCFEDNRNLFDAVRYLKHIKEVKRNFWKEKLACQK